MISIGLDISMSKARGELLSVSFSLCASFVMHHLLFINFSVHMSTNRNLTSW